MPASKPLRLVLKHRRAPGDIVVTTALVRDLKRHFGDRVEVDFRASYPAIYENNPNVSTIDETAEGVRVFNLDYENTLKRSKEERFHFITAFHKELEAASGIKVPCYEAKPSLFLTPKEKKIPPVRGRYWLVVAGGKSDMTVKHWDFTKYQETVDRLREFGLRFVQTGAAVSGHIHPPLFGTLNLVGWGSLRHLIWQVQHAEGVICPITCAMHVAAALDKPCVVIAGGRESPWWEHYSDKYNAFGSTCENVKVPHRFLHTVGSMDCCEKHGCLATKVEKSRLEDVALCQRPVTGGNSQRIAECMAKITVDHVVEAVLSYYEDGTLPKIGKPKEYDKGIKDFVRV